jgi:hypothetical protein
MAEPYNTKILYLRDGRLNMFLVDSFITYTPGPLYLPVVGTVF